MLCSTLHQWKLSQLILAFIAASSILVPNENLLVCHGHAFGKKKIRKLSGGVSVLRDQQTQRGPMMQGLGEQNIYSRAHDATQETTTTTTSSGSNIFYDSFLLYRGGDNTDNTSEDNTKINSETEKENTADTAATNDAEEDTAAEEKKKEGLESETIHVSLHSTTTTTTTSDNNKSYSDTTHKVKQQHGKKFNAVGDPDGNDSSASDSESDDDDDEQQQEKDKVGGESEEEEDSFEVMMELASRREGMKQKINEMEKELLSRKRTREEDDDNDDVEIDLDVVTDDDDDEGDNTDASYESTSYHLAGTDVIKQDDILRRQRKYKRGAVFKKDGAAQWQQ